MCICMCVYMDVCIPTYLPTHLPNKQPPHYQTQHTTLKIHNHPNAKHNTTPEKMYRPMSFGTASRKSSLPARWRPCAR